MTTTNLLHRANLKEFLAQNDGKMLSVDFVKKDGCKRTLVGRSGVKSYSKGGPSTVEAPHRPYITLFDMQAMGYRAVNLATVSCVRVNGTQHAIVG